MNDAAIVLIPYIEHETGAAEVWIGRYAVASEDSTKVARQAVEDFAKHYVAPDDTAGVLEHCDGWHADRVLLPTNDTPVRWTAYQIAEALSGRLVEVN